MVSGAGRKRKPPRISQVHRIARRAAELLPRDRQGRQHGSEAEFSFVSR
jgi:hypothetical protein